MRNHSQVYFCLVMMWIFEFPTDSTVCITCIPLPLQIQNFLRNHLIISRVDLIFVSCLWVLSKRPSMHTLKLLALKITSYGKYCVLINLHSGGIYIRPQLLKYRCIKNFSLEMIFYRFAWYGQWVPSKYCSMQNMKLLTPEMSKL